MLTIFKNIKSQTSILEIHLGPSTTFQTTQLSKKLGYHKIIRLFLVEIATKRGGHVINDDIHEPHHKS
jgi:hypothetical protein